MLIRIMAPALAALAIASAPLPAAAKPIGAKAFLKAVNTNADKTISRDELDAYAKKKFAEIEHDNDKTLDAKELHGRLNAAGLADADKDKDKTVDEAEFVGYADKLFDEANKKGDKSLDLKELESPAGKKLRALLY